MSRELLVGAELGEALRRSLAFGREGLGLRKADLEMLKRYDWPGNVRELQNVIERAVITARGGVVRFDRTAFAAAAVDPVSPPVDQAAPDVLTPDQLRDQERRNTLAALTQTNRGMRRRHRSGSHRASPAA